MECAVELDLHPQVGLLALNVNVGDGGEAVVVLTAATVPKRTALKSKR